jgi:dTDP-4-dehydrorhamnose reductase
VDKLLIVGADTMLGANLALALRNRWQVVLLGGDETPMLDGCLSSVCDLSDCRDTSYRVLVESPRAIVHCSRLATSGWDMLTANEPIDTQELIQQALSLASAAEQAGCPLTVLTTDAIFSGPRMFHCEPAPATANHSMAEAAKTFERAMAKTPALIVRTHAYGWSPVGAPQGFAETAWENLNGSIGCPVDAQNYCTPILATDLAPLVCKAIELNLRGVYHLTGAERTNQYRFAAEMAVACGLTGRQVLLEPPKRRTSNRPFMDETSLNTGMARRDLRMPLPMLREGLARFADQANNGFRDTLRSAYRAVKGHQHAA